MRLHAFLGLLLAASVSAHSWQVDLPRRQANDVGMQQQQQQQQQEAAAAMDGERPSVRCFGLSRRTRQQAVQAPYLYNVRTGQSSPVPAFLFSAENWVINKMESEGWEVRTRQVYVPKHTYDRVPVCCPWDNQCRHGRQPQTVTSPAGPGAGPCANGGQLIYRDGQQKCECPPGFGGPWCQISDMGGALSAGQPFPSGPLTRVAVSQGPFSEMVREAELWRRKVLQSRQGGQFSQGAPPMLSPRDHLLASVAGPWAQQAAMWHQQALRSRMAQAMAQAQMAQTQMAQSQWGRNNAGQMQQQQQHHAQLDVSPYQLLQAMQQRGGNPYSAMDPRAVMAMATQTAIQAGVMRGYYTALAKQEQQRQQNLRRQQLLQQQQQQQQQGANPYSRRPQDVNNPYIQALLRMHNLQATGGNPYGPMQNPRPRMMDNPYDRIPPFRGQPDPANTGIRQPQARTPWDLDPFGNQVPAFMRGDPRRGPPNERQLMAMAMYQHLMAHHRPAAGQSQPRPGYPEGMAPRRVKDFDTQEPGVPYSDGQTEENPEMGSWYDQQAEEDAAVDVPPQGEDSLGIESSGPDSEMGVGDAMSPQMPPMATETDPNINGEESLPPMMSGNPAMSMGPQPPMAGGPGMMMGPQPPQPPTPEEIQQMQQCQEVLAPKLDACLQGHDMTLEKFMNPEYMPAASQVCEDSVAVGQCITQLDGACGEGVENMMVTRRMLGSVLQMMTMVCRQIEARGDAPIPPLQTQHGVPPMQMGDEREPLLSSESDSRENVPGPAVDDAPAMLGTDLDQEEAAQEPSVPASPEQAVKEQQPKLSNSKQGEEKEAAPATPASAASQSQNGHDHAHPVSAEKTMFGLPLWMLLFIGLVSLLVLMLVAVIACLCVRRRRGKKIDIEIEKVPEPLDGKLYTVGIPPPSYSTTTVPQTHDGLNLPPLDLHEDSVVVPVGDDDGDDKASVDEKPPLEVSDADDESDEKEKEEGGKKKKNADKKGKE